MLLARIKTSQKLEQILLNFIDVLRINILMVDPKGIPILAPKTSGFGFHGSSQWGILKHLGTTEFLSKFKTEGDYLISIDDFGFQSFAIPIAIKGLDPLGYLIVGPVILNRQFEQSRYKTIAQEHGIIFLDFLEYLNEVRMLSFNSLKSILDLLLEISQYALRLDPAEKHQPVVKNDQTMPTHPVYSNLLNLSMALTQAECGSIMLLNKMTNELSIQVFKGNDLARLQNTPIKLGEGIAGLAAQKKESFVIHEGDLSNRIRHLLKKPELKCALILPIIKDDQEVLGVMNLSTYQEASRLSTHSQEILKSLTKITSESLSSFL